MKTSSITSLSTTLPQAQAITLNLTLPQYSPYQYQTSPFPTWLLNLQQLYYPMTSTPAATSTSSFLSSTNPGHQPPPPMTSPTPAIPTHTYQSVSDQQHLDALFRVSIFPRAFHPWFRLLLLDLRLEETTSENKPRIPLEILSNARMRPL